MFRTKYTLAELARMLRRSKQSLLRDIKMGRLPAGSSQRRRSMGGSTRYEFSHPDLVRNLPSRDLDRLNTFLGKRHVPTEEPVATRGIKRCKACDMFRPVSKFPYDHNTFDKLNTICITCIEKAAAPKVVLKKELAAQRMLTRKKTDWAGILKRDKK